MAFVAPLVAAIPGGLATAFSIGGTVIGAYGAMQAGAAGEAAGEYNARIADRDAAVADQNRQLNLTQTRIAADDKRRENRRVMASIRANYGASGLSLAGSPLDVLADTAVEQELDVQRVEYEGRVRGREGALQMLGLGEDAALSRLEGASARTRGNYSAIGGGLSGAGNVLARTA